MGTIEVKGQAITFNETKKYKSIGVVESRYKKDIYDVYDVQPHIRLQSHALNAAPITSRITLEQEVQLIDEFLRTNVYHGERGTCTLAPEDIPAFQNAKDLYSRVLQALKRPDV